VLFDAVKVEQTVDAEAALEFMKEATKLASTTELEDIGLKLEHKCSLFRNYLAEDRIFSLEEEGFREMVGTVFSLRRKAKRLLRANSFDRLRRELEQLLYGDGELAARFEHFVASIDGVEPAMKIALASEVLHFTRPDRCWLWAHWIWNPSAGNGALALVTQDGVDLTGANSGEVYLKVGRALELVDARGHALGYSRSGRGFLGTDVFLACVYAVYMYTVFRVKLSQEFNRILPELPELVERVLGVHHHGQEVRTGEPATA
jgi:hypothetical protein